MARMPQTVAALQAGSTVCRARLVSLNFSSGIKLLHQGYGPLHTADGRIWEGLGQLGQISDIDRAVVPSSGGPTLSLSGVEPNLIARTTGNPQEYKRRPALIFDQHFTEDLGLLDAPFCFYAGLMDLMTINDQGPTAIITLSLLTLLHHRRRPAFGYLNDASQQTLYPGDLGLSDIASLVQRTATWPAY